jgi:hypothetical protein
MRVVSANAQRPADLQLDNRLAYNVMLKSFEPDALNDHKFFLIDLGMHTNHDCV